MTDADWLDEEPAPPKKKGIGKWLALGCGCGCLLLVVAIVSVGVLGMRAVDPERQWPKIEALLAFDERPDLDLQMGVPLAFVGMEQFVLVDRGERLQILIQSFGADAPPETLDPLFSEGGGPSLMGLGQPVDPELTEIEVQGRLVRALRFESMGGFGEVMGPGVRLDLSREGRCLSVQLCYLGSRDTPTDEELAAALAEFDIWRED